MTSVAQILADVFYLNEDLQRDARFLLAGLLQKSTTFFVSNPNFKLSLKQIERFEHGLSELKNGKPLAYILGNQPFWSLDFLVNEHTLIPRPDTEVLVEQALKMGAALEFASSTEKLNMLDLGTGSGIIAVCLKHERPSWQVTATDFSSEALKVAQHNAKHNQADVRFLLNNWFAPIAQNEKFHLIVSNPPYIAADDVHLSDLIAEPMSALVADDGGLADVAYIAKHAPLYLCDDGWLLIEHGYTQGVAVRDIFVNNGFTQVKTVRDYGGNERVTMGQWRT